MHVHICTFITKSSDLHIYVYFAIAIFRVNTKRGSERTALIIIIHILMTRLIGPYYLIDMFIIFT